MAASSCTTEEASRDRFDQHIVELVERLGRGTEPVKSGTLVDRADQRLKVKGGPPEMSRQVGNATQRLKKLGRLVYLSGAGGGWVPGKTHKARTNPRDPTRGGRQAVPAPKMGRPAGISTPKRSQEALEEAGKMFADFVKKNPGLRIEQINQQLGTTTAELALPIRKLVADRAITTQGQKRATCYFPPKRGSR